MPELPEVETIRKDLQYAVLGKPIRLVHTYTGRCVKGDLQRFSGVLRGNSITAIHRRGKLLLFELASGDQTLLVHLKMTGQLICQVTGGLIVGGHPMAKIDDLPNAYTHVGMHFTDGSILYFNDVRTFGYLSLVSSDEIEGILRRYGVEPLSPEFSWDVFQDMLSGRRTNLKAFLLNQSLIAGIGNIYADEICYRAKVRPDRAVDTLSSGEKKRIFNSITAILIQAVAKRGTTFSNYVDASGKKGGYLPYLKVYNREGQRCERCGDDFILKTRVAGRGTHYCQSCQE